jgi:hypothetical protein
VRPLGKKSSEEKKRSTKKLTKVHHNASQALLSLIFEMEMTVVKVKL